MSSSSTDSAAAQAQQRRGVLAASGAFFLWGIFPIYWKELTGISPLEVIAHRVVWSLLFLLIVLRQRGRIRDFVTALRTPRLAGLYLVSGTLLAINWLTYVFAVTSDQIVEASLGYFLTPLLNVVLGLVVLRERLRRMQQLAVACAAAGVAVELVALGKLPWIALVLAASFSIYGLIRKQGSLGPLTGLGVETALLAPIAAAFIVGREAAGVGLVGDVSALQHALVLAAGVVTAVPLLLFATAARALPLTSVGLFQYLSPSVQLLLGVLVYGESFGSAQAASFSLIWVALAIYTVDGWRRARASARSAAALVAD